MKFSTFWKTFISEKNTVSKTLDRLSKEEINEIQKLIKKMQGEGKSASVIISHLQKYNDKLSEYYKAKRAFDTENKNLQTQSVMQSAARLDIDKFQCLIGPNACPICRAKTQNGKKIFTEKEIIKGDRPSFHPNCYCTLIPY